MTDSDGVLFVNSVVCVSYKGDHLTIEAVEGGICIDEDSVEAVIRESERVLRRRVKFRTTWDLQFCPLPTASVVARCTRWAVQNRTELNSLNTRLAVLTSSATLLGIVRVVLSVMGPRCPLLVSQSRSDVAEFMR